jgi:hypothetical protein
MDQRLGQLVRDGILASGRDPSQWLARVRRAAEPAEPMSAAQVRAQFHQLRELHPDAPTAGELLRQMREDES